MTKLENKMTKSLRVAQVALLMLVLSYATSLLAQGTPTNLQISQNGQSAEGVSVYVLVGGNKFSPDLPPTGTTNSAGSFTIPAGILSANKPVQMKAYKVCINGQKVVFIIPVGAESLLPADTKDCRNELLGFILLGGGDAVIDFTNNTVTQQGSQVGGSQTPQESNSGLTTGPAPRGSLSSPQTSMSSIGSGIQFQLRGFAGASLVNGNTPATGGFNTLMLFPLSNRIAIGPSAGFQWINSSIVNSIGSQQPGSTFIHTGAGFKQGNFGGGVVFLSRGWQLGIHGGATVAGSSLTQQSGFCGLGNATSPAGCTVFGTTTTHDTVVGPVFGGDISHFLLPHVGIFVGYDYSRLSITLPSSGSSTTSSRTTIDLNHSTVEVGFTFYVGDLMKH